MIISGDMWSTRLGTGFCLGFISVQPLALLQLLLPSWNLVSLVHIRSLNALVLWSTGSGFHPMHVFMTSFMSLC
jgi:hypothetical protein